MCFMKTGSSAAARFIHDQRGASMMVMGLGFFMLMAAVGSSIDMGRAQIVKSRLSSALDAAGLAAGATAKSRDVQTEASNYFFANFPQGDMDADVHDLVATLSEDKTMINLSVVADIDTTFMRIFGIEEITVNAQSEVTITSRGLELVMVIDTTGSMAWDAGGLTRIQAAKNAASDLINILFGEETPDNLWVGIVPFAQAVNVGPEYSGWTSGSFNWGPTSWMGCVDAREASGRDVTEDPPSVALFPKYYWPCDGNNGWYGNNSSKTDCDTWGSSFGYKTPLSTSRGPNKYCSQAVTELTSNKAVLLNDISTLSPDGNTHIVLGAAWGWRMLSPLWRGQWNHELVNGAVALPLDYNTDLMDKAVILMTDGDNTISNGTRGAYWYLSDGKLGTTSSWAAEDELNDRTQEVCTGMKNQGIIVYTIAFGTGIGSTAQNMLRDCASKTSYYFYSPTGADLQAAFHAIADSLANLRLSK